MRLGEPDVLERQAGLRAHRRQQRHVLARIRLFREPGSEHEQALDLARPAHQRHQRLRRQRRHRRPGLAGLELRGIEQQRPSAPHEIHQLRRRNRQARVVARQLLVRRCLKRPVVAAAQEHEQRLRMQRLQHRVVDHLGKRRAVVGRARLLRQRHQQVPRVVGRRGRTHGPAAPCAGCHTRRPTSAIRPPKSDPTTSPPRVRSISPRQRHAVEQPREAQRHGDARKHRHRHQSPANQQVARAAAQQHRNLHRPVLHHRVAERQRNREEQQDRRTPRTTAAGRRAACRSRPTTDCSTVMGVAPTSRPKRMTRVLRRTSTGPNAFCTSDTTARRKNPAL